MPHFRTCIKIRNDAGVSAALRATLAILIFSMALLVPLSQPIAFFGNIKVFGVKLPCAIGCGGSRGIINGNFLGDAVNSFVTGPSIESFEAASNRSIDRGMAKLDETLVRRQADFFAQLTTLADSQRDTLIARLNDAAQESLASLDDVLTEKISSLDRSLEARLGNLELLLNSSVQTLSSSLKNVLLFGFVLAVVGYVLFEISRSVYQKREPARQAAIRFAPIVLAALLIAVCVHFAQVFNDRWVRQETERKFAQNFNSSLAQADLNMAVYYATQLQFADRGNVLNAARAEKAKIVRDVLARPALYRTPNGERELLTRISDAQATYAKAQNSRDIDLSVLYAFTLWQRGNDRVSEYLSALIMASQLLNYKERQTDNVLLMPLAQHYLESYLTNPLPDSVVSTIIQKSESVAADGVFVETTDDGAMKNPSIRRRYRVAELRDILNQHPVDNEQLAQTNTLFAYLKVSTATIRTYRTVVSSYAEIVRLNSELAVAPVDKKVAVRASLRKIGGQLVSAWNAHITFLAQTELPDQRSRLNNFRGLWPIYSRAVAASEIKDAEDAIGPSDPGRGVHTRWLQEIVQPIVRDTAYRIMVATTNADYRANNERLVAIEKAGKDFLHAVAELKTAPADVSKVINTGRAFATLTPVLGLMGCSTPATSTFACDAPDSLPAPLGTLMFKTYSALDTNIVEQDPVLGSIVGQRTIPAF